MTRSAQLHLEEVGLSMRPLAPNLGAVVSGLDLSLPDAAEFRWALYEAFLVYGALLFEGQELTPDDEERVLGYFDRPQKTDLYGNDLRLDGHPAIRVLSNLVNETRRVGIGRGRQGPEWHCDGTASFRQPVASQLYCLEANDVGGDTLFADGAVAYETLPDEFRARLDPLVAVYNSDHLQREPAVFAQREVQLSGAPDVDYPIVLVHPETCRRALYFSADEMVAIIGLSEEERNAVIEALSSHLFDHPGLAYRHHWRPGDLMVWDNRRVIHSATFYDYDGHPRLLHHICGAGRGIVTS
jgi:taurine dioxygenase